MRFPFILTYHRIALADVDPWSLAVPPALFEEQLASLKQRRLVLPLVEFGRLHCAKRLQANAVAITFDDGYACNALVAAPLLKKYGLPATVFLATRYISSDEEFWWDALERIFLNTDAKSLNLSINGKTTSIALGSRAQLTTASQWDAMAQPKSARQVAYLKFWSRLRLARDGERRQAMDALHRQTGVSRAARPSHRVMTKAEVLKISKSGLIDIGAHSVTHPALSQLPRAEQKSEIECSRDACYDLVGRHPRAFAYPYGDYDDEVAKIVRSAGFYIACTAVPCGVSDCSQMLQMPRLGVGVWSASQLASHMDQNDRGVA